MARSDRYLPASLFDRPSAFLDQPIYERTNRARQGLINAPVGDLAKVTVGVGNRERHDCRAAARLAPRPFEWNVAFRLCVRGDGRRESRIDERLNRRARAKA